MMLRNSPKYGFVGWVIIATGLYGCASLGPVIGGATMAINAAQTAQQLLGQLDGYYDSLVIAKDVPSKLVTVTKILSNLDQAAKTLQGVAGGKSISDTDLNAVAGAVIGGQAVANKLQRNS
jgi:hypothetical protein